MPSRPTLKIVLIEDNFVQRTLIRDFLKIIEGENCNLEIYTSSNGVEGLGYVFLTKPDIVIIDSTLPDYGGLELVDYLNTNLKKLEDITFLSVIVLAENEEAALLSPEFVTFNKKENDFLYRLMKLLEINIAQASLRTDPKAQFHSSQSIQEAPPLSKVFLFGNAKKVLKWSNRGDLLMKKAQNSGSFARFYLHTLWLFTQIFTNLYLSLFKVLKGKTKIVEANILQEKADMRQFRIRAYPTLATLGASFLFIFIQVFIFLAGGFAWIGNHHPAMAANITWDGGGTDMSCGGNAGDGNKWSCPENWSTDTVPGANDTVLFNSTSLKSSVVDIDFAGNIANLNLGSTYTGSLSLERDFQISNSFIQSNGNFSGSNVNITVSGSFTVEGGVFLSTEQNLYIGGDFTHTGGAFQTTNGIAHFINGTATIACGNASFIKVIINANSNATKTFNSACNLPLGANPTVNGLINLHGTFTGTGTLTTSHQIHIQSNGNFSGFSGYVSNGPFNITLGPNTLDFSNYSFLDFNSSFTLNSGIFISTPNNMNVAANMSILAVNTTFNANGGTLILDGGNSFLICSNSTFNKVILNGNALTKKTISNSCNLPLGNNPTINGWIDLNGTLSGTGLLTTNDTFIFKSSTATLSGFNGFRLNNTAGNPDAYFSIDTPANTVVNFSSYSPVDINGDFLIYSGTFTAPSTMTVSRHFYTETNTFVHNNGTVVFDGTNQILSGTTTYNNFTKTVSAPDTFFIAAGLTKTITGTFTLKGSPTGTLTINATGDGAFGNSIIDPQGPRDIAYLSVRNNTNINASPMLAAGLNITNAGNNIGWDFNNAPNAPTSLGPSILTGGNFTNNITPTLQFNISDPDTGDQLKYLIEIDNNADFGSPEIAYTSALGAQGPRSFSVGQDAGTGTYAIGQSGQTLAEGPYYWRVKGIDQNNASGIFTTANNGNFAFRVDTTPPTGTLAINEGSSTNTPTIMLQISAIDNLSGVGQMTISENSDFSDATYETYFTYKQFTLSNGNGLKTVNIRFKDTAGNESIKYTASIMLNAPVATPTPTATPSPTNTPTPTSSPTSTPVPTKVVARVTATPKPTLVQTVTLTPTAITPASSPTQTITPTPSPTVSPTPSTTLSPTNIPLITTTENENPTLPTTPNQPIIIKAIESIQIKAEDSAPEILKPIISNVGALGITSILLIALAINIESMLSFIRLILFGGLFLPFLNTYFTRKKHSGSVIDEFTKDGIGFVTISVIDEATGRLIERVVTNWSGKYFLKLHPGKYRIELYSSKYLSRVIKTDITESVVFAHIIEMAKDPQKDIAAQLQFRLFAVDPRNIALIGGLILSMLNLIYMRNLVAMGLVVVMVSGFVFFKVKAKVVYA